MRDNQIVAYLDLLGFSELVKKYPRKANELLFDYQQSLENLVEVHELLNRESNIQKRHPFMNIIPFSDSLFISGNASWGFFEALAIFLYRAWMTRARDYGVSHGAENPIQFDQTEYVAGIDKGSGNWPPILFRGGIAYGQVSVENSMGRIEGQDIKISNLFGIPIVKSVALEKNSAKGPRLFLEKALFQSLSQRGFFVKKKKYFSILDEKSDVYEFLWIAAALSEQKNARDTFIQMFRGVVAAWKIVAHETYSNQYWELVRLMVKSAKVLKIDIQHELQSLGLVFRFKNKI